MGPLSVVMLLGNPAVNGRLEPLPPMPAVPNRAPRLIALTVSSAVSLVAAWAFFHFRAEPATVRVTDNADAIGDLLEARQGEQDSGQSTAPLSGEGPPPLAREALTEELVGRFFSVLKNSDMQYDPLLLFRRAGHQDRRQNFKNHPAGGWDVITNSYGMREFDDVSEQQPDLRILVAGDSHTHGMCANNESFTNLLESQLAAKWPGQTVEALNTGTGAYSFYNYLGVLERYRDLKPDLFVVTVYGGNDWSGTQSLYRYFNRLGRPNVGPHDARRLTRELWRWGGLGAQEVNQAIFFRNNPEAEAFAVEVAASAVLEMKKICDEDGIRLLCVYLPPPHRGQRELFKAENAEAMALIGWEPGDLSCSDRMADSWLAFLKERDIARLDLRPLFAAADERYYWNADRHINLAAHAAMADALAPLVEALVL